MELTGTLAFVFVAGLLTALATGLGALRSSSSTTSTTAGASASGETASGIMLSASGFGLFREGLNYGTPLEVAAGAAVGVVLVLAADRIIHSYKFAPREIAEADFKKLVLIAGVLTVHSFPEGVAVGVSFADMGLDGGFPILGFTVPLLAVFMTIAISIHNVPEGLAVSIPLHEHGARRWKLVGVAVFTSVPSPSARCSRTRSSRSHGRCSPSASASRAARWCSSSSTSSSRRPGEVGERLPGGGARELATGLVLGVAGMVPMLFVT